MLTSTPATSPAISIGRLTAIAVSIASRTMPTTRASGMIPTTPTATNNHGDHHTEDTEKNNRSGTIKCLIHGHVLRELHASRSLRGLPSSAVSREAPHDRADDEVPAVDHHEQQHFERQR